MTCSNKNKSLVHLFLSQVEVYQDRPALLCKNKITKQFDHFTWNQWSEFVRNTALGLWGVGVRTGDKVALLSENRPEWSFADLGILSLGAVTVPIYPTSSCDEIQYILENADIRTVVLSCREQLNKLVEIVDKTNRRINVVLFDEVPADYPFVKTLNQIQEQGAWIDLNNPDLLRQHLNCLDGDGLATLIYTSGTTGAPKGVMLSHKNFIENYLGANEYIKIRDSDISLSFLPLSHVFERLAGYYFMMANGATIAYAESMQTVAEDMQVVKPTVAACVPRFYEKIHGAICEKMESSSAFVQKLFKWAIQVGSDVAQRKLSNMPLGFSLRLSYFVASKLVFSKIKKRLGGRIRFFISGGAPLPKHLGEFFFAADILILEGYGLTETSPVIAVNYESKLKFGTVGQVLPNVQVKIADDGEILTKSPCVMQGYYKNPESTQEVIKEGWFYTGDIGEIDGEGFLKITDRKKDIIVTSGGKNIAPQNLENMIQSCKAVSQCVIVGDKRNYLVALIVPNKDEVLNYAASKGYDCSDFSAVLTHKDVYDWVKASVDETTRDFPSYQQIKYIALLEKELTQADGDLTPTLKVKRKKVVAKYASIIDGMYAKGQSYSGT